MTESNTTRTILITGCSSGIGLDAARTLRARGWRVLATCRAQVDCDRLMQEGLESFPLDLDSETSIEAAAARASDMTDGRIDALFNNGAFAIPGAVEDLPRTALRSIFETNLFGQIDLTNRILPVMCAHGSGRIVMNSSILGFAAMPWRGAYIASKFALEGISDTLRLELEGTGIHVSLIEPGPIDTPFRLNSIPHFEKHINWRASPNASAYEAKLLKRLYQGGPQETRFELPASAVTARLIHAIESPRPKIRYRITTPTRIAAVLVRLLPARVLDAILRRL
jgi:NAD(P)-dependent dehydrogenase (short-subunit alcohol dehydrogenase family)